MNTHENKNIGALYKNIAFLENELTEIRKNKSLMEAQTAVLHVTTGLKQ